MNDLDDRIRAALTGLRRAPAPELPRLEPRPEPRATPTPLVAAAAMLALLAGSLYFLPARPAAVPAGLADRITALESRIAAVEHQELRRLLGRELALLRRELELATSSSP